MSKLIKNLKEKSGEFGAVWGQRVVKYRWPVLIGTIMMALLAGAGGMMKFNSDYHVFFSDDNPQLLAYDGLQNKYTKDDNVFIVIEPKDGNIFTPETLSAIEELTAAACQTPHSSRVDTITNFQYTINNYPFRIFICILL